MSRTTLGIKNQLYRERIVNPDVAADQPVFGSENSRELGILVYNPGAVTMTVSAFSVHRVTGKISSIPTGGAGAKTIVTNEAHGLRENDLVVISNSTSAPSIDGTFTATNVTARTFDITVASAITEGGVGVFAGPEREFEKVSAVIDDSTELIADHMGGAYKVKLTGFVGPLSAANAVDVYVKSL
jgi:hypothetical protein